MRKYKIIFDGIESKLYEKKWFGFGWRYLARGGRMELEHIIERLVEKEVVFYYDALGRRIIEYV